MSWNEVKIWMAPTGSEIVVEGSPLGNVASGESVSIVTVNPGDDLCTKLVQEAIDWLTNKGFRLARSNGSIYDMSFEDVSVLVIGDPTSNRIKEVGFNLSVDLNARSRIPVWDNLVTKFSEAIGLKLIDPQGALASPGEFQRLVERSFAWECFLEREKNLGLRP